jgi:hypothetical protein
MIEIPQPSIVLNAFNQIPDIFNPNYNVPGTKYEMWETLNVSSTDRISGTLVYVSLLASGAVGHTVKCLVINCHGNYDKGTRASGKEKPIATGGFGLDIGEGITYENADVFSNLRGLVKCIIITACGAADVTNKNKSIGDGEVLCSRIARAADAYVIAPRILQAPTYLKLPKNHIDNFEGEVVRFNRAGVIDGYRLLGRKLIREIF